MANKRAIAGGVALFPEDAPAPKASGWLSAKREPRRGRKGPRETNACVVSPAPEGAQRGFVSGRQPGGTFESETITAGLAPDGVYVYAEWGEGRRNRPLSQGEHGCPKQSRTLEGKQARTK